MGTKQLQNYRQRRANFGMIKHFVPLCDLAEEMAPILFQYGNRIIYDICTELHQGQETL